MEIYQMYDMYKKEMVDQWCSKTDISSIIFMPQSFDILKYSGNINPENHAVNMNSPYIIL